MKVFSEREDRNIATINLKIKSIDRCMALSVLAPDRTCTTLNGELVVFEPHEMGAVTINFNDSREIDELIAALVRFREGVIGEIGYWI